MQRSYNSKISIRLTLEKADRKIVFEDVTRLLKSFVRSIRAVFKCVDKIVLRPPHSKSDDGSDHTAEISVVTPLMWSREENQHSGGLSDKLILGI